MRSVIILFALACSFSFSANAQGRRQPQQDPYVPSNPNSPEKIEEMRRHLEQARERQKVADARNTRIWERWVYAVCIGCGPRPKGFRYVYTSPSRVLAGYIAADDDDLRSRGALRVTLRGADF